MNGHSFLRNILCRVSYSFLRSFYRKRSFTSVGEDVAVSMHRSRFFVVRTLNRCRTECRTQIEMKRLRARSACQENATTKTIAPWKTKERKGRICVIRDPSRPIRGIVYTESRVTCSRRFMKCFVQ